MIRISGHLLSGYQVYDDVIFDRWQQSYVRKSKILYWLHHITYNTSSCFNIKSTVLPELRLVNRSGNEECKFSSSDQAKIIFLNCSLLGNL